MNYKQMLQKHNLKVTPQRLEIVNLLFKIGHMNIDNLYKFLKRKFPSLSLATVYKNIYAMSEKNFLSEVKIPHEKNVYELTKKEHSHIVCTKCHTIKDIDLDISMILNQAKMISDYHLNESSIVFNGLCPKCYPSN